LAEGYIVKEKNDNIDLVISNDGKRIAVEIETCKSDIRANIDKALRHYPKMFLIPTNQASQAIVMKLITHIPSEKKAKIRIIPVREFKKY